MYLWARILREDNWSPEEFAAFARECAESQIRATSN
jgi:hypothetical protein